LRLRDVLGGIQVLATRGDLNGEVTGICYDSRRCREGCLFVAVGGLKDDGHRHIDDAVARGAKAVVYEREMNIPAGVAAVRVADSRLALGRLGCNFHGDPSSAMTLVGVVGTNGKTTVTYLLEAILNAAGRPCGVLGTVNYRFGDVVVAAPNTTPESYEFHRILDEMKRAGVEACVAEISSHAVALRRVEDLDFDVGVFTNLSRDHLDFHGTMEEYFSAKRRFFTEILPRSRKGRGFPLVVNVDDPKGREIVEAAPLAARTYGVEGEAHVRPLTFRCDLAGIQGEIAADGRVINLSSPLIGRFNLYNILAAVGAALSLDVDPEAIVRGVAALGAVPGRLEKVGAGEGIPQVFVDYAHTEDALRRVLDNLAIFRRSRIITVFGCGGDRDRGKRPLMGRAAALGSDLTVVTSDNPRSEDPLAIIGEITAGIPSQIPRLTPSELRGAAVRKAYCVIPDRREAIDTAVGLAEPEDIVLIAGKGHEDYQIIGDRRIFFDDRLAAAQALASYVPPGVKR